MKVTPAARRAVVRSAVTALGIVILGWMVARVVERMAHGDGSQDDFLWWVCFPILFFGLPTTLRLARRIWGAVMEWPAWRNRNEDPDSRVFRGHPEGRWETLHEARARRYVAIKAKADQRWHWTVNRGVKEIYGEDEPPENPEVPEWLKRAP